MPIMHCLMLANCSMIALSMVGIATTRTRFEIPLPEPITFAAIWAGFIVFWLVIGRLVLA